MSVLAANTRLRVFEGLRRYSKTEMQLLNRFAEVFGGASQWPAWLQDGIGRLLEVPGKRAIVLDQVNQIEGGSPQRLLLEKNTVTFGRDLDNDVVISLPAVGRHHARISQSEGQYLLDDLGSANGTYLNDEKLDPLSPAPLKEGAQFAIFPYQFTFSTEQLWRRAGTLRVSGGRAEPAAWNKRRVHRASAFQFFTVHVAPGAGSAVLGVSEDLLKTLTRQISRVAVARVLPSDAGVAEFLALSVIERANRDAKFPHRFSLLPFEPLAGNEFGIALECTLGLDEAAGVIGLFLPESLLKAIQWKQRGEPPAAAGISWRVLATSGYFDLSFDEIAGLETGDVALAIVDHALLLPPMRPRAECGWRVHAKAARRLAIEEYFERSEFSMDTPSPVTPEQSSGRKPDLSALPVRVHIVLGQLEMTLADLNRLAPGTIVELNEEKPEAVQLAVNGKIAGSGELVEIEGRLGVRILHWAAQ